MYCVFVAVGWKDNFFYCIIGVFRVIFFSKVMCHLFNVYLWSKVYFFRFLFSTSRESVHQTGIWIYAFRELKWNSLTQNVGKVTNKFRHNIMTKKWYERSPSMRVCTCVHELVQGRNGYSRHSTTFQTWHIVPLNNYISLPSTASHFY